MAKLLLIALTLGIAVCSQDAVKNPISYTEGHEYLYDYETQIMSGLPVGSKDYSGLKLVTRIRFQMISLFNWKMEFINPRLYKINVLVEVYDPTIEMLPVETFTELLDQDAINMKKELANSVSFSYTQGHVENVMTAKSDPEWSVNVKKGCLSLLEMNFNERHSLDPLVDVKTPNPRYTMYRVFEPSVTGNCETMYRMKTETNVEGTPNMKLEKVRNFENCMERVSLLADLLKGRTCESCTRDTAMHTFTAQSLVRYEMTGTPDDYMIVSAVCESMYAFSPFVEQKGRVMTFTNQTLTLVDTKKGLSPPIPDPVSPQAHRRPLKAVRSPREDKLRTTPFVLEKAERDELVQKGRKILTGIARINADKVDLTSDDLIKEMWRLLRQMDKQAIQTLMDEAMKKVNLPEKAWKVLIDLLSSVGTFESVDVLLDWIEKNKPETETALSLYWTLALTPEPDYLIVNRYMEHVRKYHLEPTNRNIWRTVWLVLGSFGLKFSATNRTIVKDIEDEMNILTFMNEESNDKSARVMAERRLEELRNILQDTIQRHNTVAEDIKMMVQELFKKGKKEYRVLALKIIHNLGFEHFLPLLKELALDKTEQLTIRHEAIDALMRHVTERINPEKIRSIVLPIYFDQTEPDSLRLIAFLQAIFSNPSKPELELIAKSLHAEPSLNVGSFVWDALIIYSNTSTTCPCIQALIHNTTLALRFARRPEESFKYSTIWVNRFINSVQEFVFTATNSIVFSPNERLPTTVSTYILGSVFGRTISVLGLRFRGRGLDALMENVLKNPQLAALQNLVSPRFKRSVSEGEERLKDIKHKIKLEPVAPVLPEGVFEFHLYDQCLYYFDLEPFLDFDAEALSEEVPDKQIKVLNQKVLGALPKIMSAFGAVNRFLKTDRTFVLPLLHTTMPTATGLPMQLYYSMIGSFKLNGEVTMRPAGPGEGSLFNGSNLMVNLKPSGLFEGQGHMVVDMKYFHCGVTTRVRNYVNMPMTMSVGGDMKKTKLFVKITDLTPERAVMHEAFSETFIRKIPFLASKYPQPLDRREIEVTDDADFEPYFYAIGKEFFGFQYTMEGHWTRSKSRNVEQFPLCGKRTMYINFDPLDTKELDIYVQHIREFVDNRNKEEQEGSWIYDTIHWLFPDKNEKMPKNLRQPPESPESPDQLALEPVEPFINLAERDLTISYLESRFMNETKFLRSGLKCGMAITITRPGANPDHRMQITTLYQMDPRGLKHWYTIDLSLFTPENPDIPWRMITSTKMFLPSKVLEPSLLLDNEYQRQVWEEINKELQRDERDFSAQFDVGYYIMIHSFKQLLISERRDVSSRTDIQELVNHILEQSVSQQMEQVETLVQDQRRLEREVRELRDRPVDIARVEGMFNELTRISKNAELILTKTEAFLDEAKSPQKPQEAVMMQYLIISQTRTLTEFERVLRKFKLVFSMPSYTELLTSLEKQRGILYKTTKLQLKLSLEKQVAEKQKAAIEVEPNEMKIHERLIKFEKKLIDILDKIVGPMSLSHEKKVLREMIPVLTEITGLYKEVLNDINSHLERFIKIDKVVRVKMAEILLQMTQVIQIIDNTVERTEANAIEESPVANPEIEITFKKGLLNIRYQFYIQVQSFAKRILLAVNLEKETIYLASIVTPEMEKDLRNLNIIFVKQIELFENLDRPMAELAEPWLQSLVEEAAEINGELHNMMMSDVHFSSPGWKISPVLMKVSGELPTQLEMLEAIRILLEEKLELDAVNDRNMDSMIALIRQVKGLIDNTVRSAARILGGFTSPPVGEHEPRRTTALSSLARQAISIDAKHLQVKSEVGKVILELTKSPSMKDVHEYEKPSKRLMRLKEQLYSIVHTITELQEEAEGLHTVLTDELTERPKHGYLLELMSAVEKRLDELISVLLSVEEPLKALASKEPSLLQPLQNLQQVKDSLQRYIHTAKKARASIPFLLKSKDPNSLEQKGLPQESRKETPLREPWQPRDFMSAYRGEVTITYGIQGKRMKTIFVQFMGRKTLQQLMWESNQILPSKQDRIFRQYLADKELPDDKTAMQYREIKTELNTYRHIHFFCTYEETLPWPIKNQVYKMHQMIKYYLYNEAYVSLPRPENPLTNKFEVVMDFDRDKLWMSMRVDTSYEVTRVDFLRVPTWFRMTVFSDTFSFEENMIHYYTGTPTESCYVTPRRITTFDGKRLEPELEVRPCESVLAMDCTPNHEFVVTQLPKSAGTPTISVITKQLRIDIIRVKAGEVTVKCDDVPVDISHNTVVKKKGEIIVHISKVFEDGVLLMIPYFGIFVASDGERTALQVSHSHIAKVCGLCGNMDGRLLNDLTGPMKILFPGPISMASTYVIPSDKCDAKSIQKELKVDEIREQSKRMTPYLRTGVLMTTVEDVHMICLSSTPIRICPDNSKPVNEQSRLVQYTCMKNGRRSRKLREKAYIGVVEEIPVSLVVSSQSSTVSEPEYCDKI